MYLKDGVALDYETTNLYTISIQLDNGTATDAQDLTFMVTDIDKVNLPNNLPDTVQVWENETVGAVIFTVTADPDPDGDTNEFVCTEFVPNDGSFTCDETSEWPFNIRKYQASTIDVHLSVKEMDLSSF